MKAIFKLALGRNTTLMLDGLELAKKRLEVILKIAQKLPGLNRQLSPKTIWTVEIVFANRVRIQQLNATYRQKNYPTDILSFPYPAIFKNEGHLGEVVVCVPVLKEQARQFGHHDLWELEILLVHGALHLLGLDHEKGEKDSQKMARWERRILKQSLVDLIEYLSTVGLRKLKGQIEGKKKRGIHEEGFDARRILFKLKPTDAEMYPGLKQKEQTASKKKASSSSSRAATKVKTKTKRKMSFDLGLIDRVNSGKA